MELHTERLVIRPVALADAPTIHAYRGDADTILANCYLDNEDSLRLLRALGFTEQARFRSDQDATGKHQASVRMKLELTRR